MHPSTPESLRKLLSYWEPEGSGLSGFADLAKEQISLIKEKIILLDQLIEQFDAHGMGFTLKNVSLDSWGIILPDASEIGRFRWQHFRADGFTGHCTYDTALLCLGDMLDGGYTQPDPEALDRLSKTSKWALGTEVTALIQACNTGQMTWEEANRQHAIIKARYLTAA